MTAPNATANDRPAQSALGFGRAATRKRPPACIDPFAGEVVGIPVQQDDGGDTPRDQSNRRDGRADPRRQAPRPDLRRERRQGDPVGREGGHEKPLGLERPLRQVMERDFLLKIVRQEILG